MRNGLPPDGATLLQALQMIDTSAAVAALQKTFAQLAPVVTSQDLDTGWRDDPRMRPALLYVGNLYRAATKRYGEDLLLTHPVWTADKVYTQWKHDPVLSKKGIIDPALAAFIQLLHDCVEEPRDAAMRNGRDFDEQKIYGSLAGLWPTKRDFGRITNGIHWMTDAAGIHGPQRIDAQIAKGLEDGICIVAEPEQLWRFNDKLEQGLSDTRQRRAFIQAKASCETLGHQLPDNLVQLRALGVPDQDIAECAENAQIKSFVLKFPAVPEADKRLYRRAMSYLKAQAKLVEAHPPRPYANLGPASLTAGHIPTPPPPIAG